MDSDLSQLLTVLASATDGYSPTEMRWHPPGQWCIADVLEHLYLTYTGTVRGFEKVMAAGKPLATAPTLAQRWRSFVLLQVGYFPRARKSPAAVQPRGTDFEKVSTEILSKVRAMDEIISACESKLGKTTKLLDHPILGPLNAAQWRKFHLVHGLHHAKQIRRLSQMMPGVRDRAVR